MSNHTAEVNNGERFKFGENWSRFLRVLNEQRINEAVKSLQTRLETTSLEGKHFLDIGSGSGLFSLAARRLGATVHSFDYDPQSVACTTELKRRFFENDNHWIIEQGSVLDEAYLSKLGQFDIVYSWGVLHHTGNMWTAIKNTFPLVAPDGVLFIAIYNDQGSPTIRWKILKKLYNKYAFLRPILVLYTLVRQWIIAFTKDTLKGNPFKSWRDYIKSRGMSPMVDVVDWIGGYPFEVAKPEEIFDFCKNRGFELRQLITCAGGLGCNEYVFKLRQA